MKVEVDRFVSEKDVVNVLADVMYASSYWCRRVDYDKSKLTKAKYDCFEEKLLDCLKNDGKVTYEDNEDDETYGLNLNNLKVAILQYKVKYGENYVDYSDSILQTALFGEVVYG